MSGFAIKMTSGTTGRQRPLVFPGVRDAWVSTDGAPEPTVGAAVGSDQTTEQLRSALLADPAAWKIPKRLLVMTTLPMTDRGNLDSATWRQRLFRQA